MWATIEEDKDDKEKLRVIVPCPERRGMLSKSTHTAQHRT